MVEAVVILVGFLAWVMVVGLILVTLVGIRREAEAIRAEVAGAVDRVEAIRVEAVATRVAVEEIQGEAADLRVLVAAIQAAGVEAALQDKAIAAQDMATEIRTTTTADRPGKIVAILDEGDDPDEER